MLSYQNILIVVTVLSFLSIAGMAQVRTSLAVALAVINVALWTIPRFQKWNQRRNAHAVEGERQLGVGNYGEAEQELILAAAEADQRATSTAKRVAILRNLVEAQRKQRKFVEARESADRAITLSSATTGQARELHAQCLESLATLLDDEGNYPQAQRVLREALEVEEALHTPNPELLARRRQMLALAYHRARDYAAASAHFADSLQSHERHFGPEHAETGRILTELGTALQAEGNHLEALRHLERAQTIREKTLGVDAPEVSQSLYHLAVAYENSGNFELAAAQLERIVQLRARQVGGSETELAIVYTHLSRACLELGRLARAEETAQSAILILEKKPSPELATSVEILARIYLRADRRGDAEAATERARSIWASVGGKPQNPMGSRQASA